MLFTGKKKLMVLQRFSFEIISSITYLTFSVKAQEKRLPDRP